MIEDDFYFTIKFKSGEEIFSKVAAEEEDRTLLILSHPTVIDLITVRGKEAGYKMESLVKDTSDDMFIVDMDEVMTISESTDIEMIVYYQEFVRRSSKTNHTNLDRKMGYISTVNEAAPSLERIFGSNQISCLNILGPFIKTKAF